MCVCERIREYNYEILTSGNWTDIEIDRRKGHGYYISSEGEECVEIKINYCPFCGRKLEEV